ncbi:MAG: porin family protein [Bdellovibrionota bacterium]
MVRSTTVFCTVMAVLSFHSIAYSQTSGRTEAEATVSAMPEPMSPKTAIDLHVGGSFNTSKYSDEVVRPTVKNQNDLMLGVGLDQHLVGEFYFRPELNFVRYSSRLSYNVQFPSGVRAWSGNSPQNLDYLELPLYAKWKYNAGSFRPFVLGGAYAGYLVNEAHIQASDRDRNPSVASNRKYEDYFNRFAFGVSGGAGLEYALDSTKAIFVNARYSHGLSDVFRDLQGASLKNRAVQTIAGFQLGL